MASLSTTKFDYDFYNCSLRHEHDQQKYWPGTETKAVLQDCYVSVCTYIYTTESKNID